MAPASRTRLRRPAQALVECALTLPVLLLFVAALLGLTVLATAHLVAYTAASDAAWQASLVYARTLPSPREPVGLDGAPAPDARVAQRVAERALGPVRGLVRGLSVVVEPSRSTSDGAVRAWLRVTVAFEVPLPLAVPGLGARVPVRQSALSMLKELSPLHAEG